MVTRQAIQVTIAAIIAIYFGRMLSDTRYYWAIIAAFVAFTGTATRAETFTKSFNRVLGTVAGLFASIWIANLTAGNVGLVIFVILASMFCGFYLIRISYAYMIFFITIMVGQMYSVLHEFSDGLLVLRLEETAIGAAAGILVSLVVVPLSATDAVRAARDAMFADLRDLLKGAARYLSPETSRPAVAETGPGTGGSAAAGSPTHPVPTEIAVAAPTASSPDGSDEDSDEESEEDSVPSTLVELDAKARALDDRFRQVALAAKPRIRPLVMGSRSLNSRRRLDLYNALAIRSRALVVGIRSKPVEHPEYAATACLSLAEVAERLMTTRPGQPMPELSKPLEDADTAILQSLPTSSGDFHGDTNVLRPLAHLHDLLSDIAVKPRNS
nr:FUSC family protein [Spelaeicoccus albus]